MPDEKTSERNPDQIDVLAELRTQLRDLLPRAIRCVVASYQQFSEQVTSDDPKQFIAYHNACRAALVHVDTLSKLTRWVVTQHPTTQDRDDLQPLLQQARRVLLNLGSNPFDTNPNDSDDDENASPEF